MNPSNQQDSSLDNGLLVTGFVIGMVVGGIAALFKAPKRGAIQQQLTGAGETLRQKIESTLPVDPIAEGLAEGKAAARRRQSELNYGN